MPSIRRGRDWWVGVAEGGGGGEGGVFDVGVG